MTACALVISFAALLSSTAPADATLPPPGSPIAASSQSRQQRIKVLTAGLRTMRRTFSRHRFDTPGRKTSSTTRSVTCGSATLTGSGPPSR
jgi:hypothetical protein